MNSHLVISALALLSVAYGHLTAICSSTDSSKPGEINFYLGTYHNFERGVPGTITISQPKNRISKTAHFSNSYRANWALSSGVAGAKHNLHSSGAMPERNAHVDCYVVNSVSAAMKPPPDGQWIVPISHTLTGSQTSMFCSHGNYVQVNMWNKINIKGAKSGDWKLQISGTDQVYDPGAKACSLSRNNPKWIKAMTVADGTPSCKGSPPVDSSIDPNSVKQCANLMGGAECFSMKCSSKVGKDAKMKGHIKCTNGKWDVTASCLGESQCANQAIQSINGIKTTRSQCQAVINSMSNGAHCANKLASIVASAKSTYHSAQTTYSSWSSKLTIAEKTKVTFRSIALNQIKAGDCGALFGKLKSQSNYAAARSALITARASVSSAQVTVTTTKTAWDTAVTQQTKEILSCKCKAQNKADSAFDKCTENNKAQKSTWSKSHHLRCVEKGTVKIGANHQSMGQCVVPTFPALHRKKMAFTVTEHQCMGFKTEVMEDEEAAIAPAVETEETEETEETVEEDDDMLVQIEESPKTSFEEVMPGWHQMDDGSMMLDSDMPNAEEGHEHHGH